MNVCIIVSNFYPKISKLLIKGATDKLKKNNVFNFRIIYVPGTHEIPVVISNFIKKYDGFVALGCIIRGETYHFELIANEVSRKIMDLSIQSNKPIGFGIITCENMQQAKARSNKIETWSNTKESFRQAKKNNKGIEAAVVVVNNIHW